MNMNVLALLEYLDEELSKASSVPLTGKRLVDAAKCQDIIRELRVNLPDDITDAERIVSERDQIIDDANREAQAIVDEAEERFRRRLEEHEITRAAREHAAEIIEEARAEAGDIHDDVLDYADKIMADLEDTLQNLMAEVRQNRGDIGREE